MSARAPSAFISWAHGDDLWQRSIAKFVFALRGNGIVADVDLFHLHDIDVDWTRYGPRAISEHDFVLIAASSVYRERWEGTNDPTSGAGAAREANVLKAIFNDDQAAFSRKVKVVLLPGATTKDIPIELRASASHYKITSFDAAGLEDLLRTMTGQPAFVASPPGIVPVLPPKFVDSYAIGQGRSPRNSDRIAGLKARGRELATLSAGGTSSEPDLAAKRATLEAAVEALDASESAGATRLRRAAARFRVDSSELKSGAFHAAMYVPLWALAFVIGRSM